MVRAKNAGSKRDSTVTIHAVRVLFWDVRSLGEYDGTRAGWNAPPRLGRLPGAIRLEYTELFDADNGTLKPAAELTTLLGAKGIPPRSGPAVLSVAEHVAVQWPGLAVAHRSPRYKLPSARLVA